jgi:phage baseplate assembly protein gpV
MKEVDQELYVYRVEAKYCHGELVSEYELRTKNGYKKVKTYNTKITGASLKGKITSIGGDKVKIAVEADQLSINSLIDEKWFLYSTVYSSPDGTGWYCMPEIGDNVRLYFPSKDEEEAYVISSVHLEVSQASSNGISQGPQENSVPRSDPDTKVISNQYKKEIIFARDYLKIKSKEGLSVTLDDAQGITIESDRGLYLKAKDIIEITSDDSIFMAAKTTIEAAQNVTNKFKLENNEMMLSGGKLKVQDQA